MEKRYPAEEAINEHNIRYEDGKELYAKKKNMYIIDVVSKRYHRQRVVAICV